MPFQRDFVVSCINEDVILGMPFLERYERQMNPKKVSQQMGSQELACNDRYEWLLRAKVQVILLSTISPRSEQMLMARVATRNYCPLGLIENLTVLCI